MRGPDIAHGTAALHVGTILLLLGAVMTMSEGYAAGMTPSNVMRTERYWPKAVKHHILFFYVEHGEKWM